MEKVDSKVEKNVLDSRIRCDKAVVGRVSESSDASG